MPGAARLIPIATEATSTFQRAFGNRKAMQILLIARIFSLRRSSNERQTTFG